MYFATSRERGRWSLFNLSTCIFESRVMATQMAHLARIFTSEYVRRINLQIVYPAQSQVVKPNELESALARPLYMSRYEPERPAEYLAATLSYGLIKGMIHSVRVH